MIAVLDIAGLSPQFMSAVQSIRTVTMPIALVVCFGGFMFVIIDAMHARNLPSVMAAMPRILCVALGLTFLPQIGNWIEQIVLGIEQESGVGNQSAFSDYLAQIQSKFGVDLSELNNLVPPSPFTNNGTVPSGSTKVTAYGYSTDLTGDSASLAAIGNHNNTLTPFTGGSTPSGAALSAAAAQQYGVSLGQSFTVQGANGQTYNLIYQDTSPSSGPNIDIFDPNQLLTGGNDNNFETGATSVTAGPTAATTADNGNPVTGFFNGLLHPAETIGASFFGMAVLFASLLAAAVWWLMSLLQTVLWYSELALAPLFVGFVMVRGYESVAKNFILSFIGISLWPIAMLITSLAVKMVIGLALNTNGNVGLGTANVAGLSWFWMFALIVLVMFGSIAGPLLISKMVMAGSGGMGAFLFGAGSAGIAAAQMGAGAAYGGGVGSMGIHSATGGAVSMASASRMNAVMPSNGVSKRPPPASNGGSES